ncbi:hypothetical protein ER45_030665 (plasmid) [Bacillus mycoides]|nr:hypothetical protein ER45_030665 [Bacillus mycoides]
MTNKSPFIKVDIDKIEIDEEMQKDQVHNLFKRAQENAWNFRQQSLQAAMLVAMHFGNPGDDAYALYYNGHYVGYTTSYEKAMYYVKNFVKFTIKKGVIE